MNQNYIAPEALNEEVVTCRHCLKVFSSLDDKITYFQGTCPSCSANPSLLQKQSLYRTFTYQPYPVIAGEPGFTIDHVVDDQFTLQELAEGDGPIDLNAPHEENEVSLEEVVNEFQEAVYHGQQS